MGNVNGQLETCSLAEVPNVITEDGLLQSPFTDEVTTREHYAKSFFLHLRDSSRVATDGKENAVWLHDAIKDEEMSVEQAFSMAKRFSSLFSTRGVCRGSVVHIVAGSSNVSMAAALAAWSLGAVVSMGDLNVVPVTVAKQLEDCSCELVVCVPETSSLIKSALKLTSDSIRPKAMCLGENDSFEDFLSLAKDVDESECPEPVEAGVDAKEETVVIIWSSGTTGHPKGICQSHSSVLTFLDLGRKGLFCERDAAVTTTCFFHVSGFFTALLCLTYGLTHHHLNGPGFSFAKLLSTVKRVRPVLLSVSAHVYVQLAELNLAEVEPRATVDDLDSVRFVVPAGAAVPRSCLDQLKRKFVNVRSMMNIYGMTELGAFTAGFTSESLGTLLAGTTVKIENMVTGDRCGPGEEGEICAKTAMQMQGYINRPEDTAAFWDDEDFGHTGDIGYYTQDGRICYVDRMKELIKYKGDYVSPTELEDILHSHPGVADCLVYGRPEPAVQELVAAVVVVKKGHQPSESVLVEFAASKVADCKRFRGGISFGRSIPRNSVGKLLRREMRQWAIDSQNREREEIRSGQGKTRQ